MVAENEVPSAYEEMDLQNRWESLYAKKFPLRNRCYDYAMWTLPYVFPREHVKYLELQGAIEGLGAKAVNHLANKLCITLFQPSQPFFRLDVQDDTVNSLADRAGKGDKQAQDTLLMIDTALARAERSAMKELDYNHFRTEATTACKYLIVTGNALLYHPEGKKGKTQVYSIKDYSVRRDLSGHVIEILTRDKKAFSTFNNDVKEKLRASDKQKYKESSLEDECDVCIYTQLLFKDDGKYHLTQYADAVKLDSEGSWPVEDLPWIVLTWNLVRGEDYGRGLVEDYAGSFHAIHVLSQAEVDVAAVAADIKFLVDPASVIDVDELNNSPSGTYHSGKPTDVQALQINKQMDMQTVEQILERLTQNISEAFLLQSGMTRDAERVTATEVQSNANELNTQHGGIYSRFAEEWQYRTAILMLKRIKIDLGANKTINPVIITGLDSLSRAGDLDNLRAMVSDLQLLAQVPPSIQQVIDPFAFIEYCGTRRGVDYQKFMKSQQQVMQEQQAQQQAEQQAVAHQAGANAGAGIAQDAANNAMQQTQQ